MLSASVAFDLIDPIALIASTAKILEKFKTFSNPTGITERELIESSVSLRSDHLNQMENSR